MNSPPPSQTPQTLPVVDAQSVAQPPLCDACVRVSGGPRQSCVNSLGCFVQPALQVTLQRNETGLQLLLAPPAAGATQSTKSEVQIWSQLLTWYASSTIWLISPCRGQCSPSHYTDLLFGSRHISQGRLRACIGTVQTLGVPNSIT